MVWDLQRRSCLGVLEGHRGTVWSISVDFTKGRALSGSQDGTFRLWDIPSDGEIYSCLHVLEGQTAGVLCIAADFHHRHEESGSCSHAVSGSADFAVRVWDLEAGECMACLNGHTSLVWAVAVDFGALRALSGSHDTSIKIWDIAEMECLHTLHGHSGGSFHLVSISQQ